MKQVWIALSVVVGVLLTIAMFTLSGWSRPPVDVVQTGYRGLGMEFAQNPRTVERAMAGVEIPEIYALDSTGGPRASEVYDNVQVLGDLSVEQFDRLMAAIAEWVAPDADCGYCHNLDNLAEDSVYAKVVARRMIEMTRNINSEWDTHVADTGVTCYTCHRGEPVPAQVWFMDPGPPQARGMAADRAGQNIASATVGATSLPYDPFTTLLNADDNIRVVSETALPNGNDANIKQTEVTYGLMMHVSEALGVNCTFCHNSRSFFDWDQSAPQRTTAWHGIRMVGDINATYLEPLTGDFPEERLGPTGDVGKVNCATCHQGANKPLYGARMLDDFPSLSAAAER